MKSNEMLYSNNVNTWNPSAETTPRTLQTAEDVRVSLLYPHPEAQLAYIHRATRTVSWDEKQLHF